MIIEEQYLTTARQYLDNCKTIIGLLQNNSYLDYCRAIFGLLQDNIRQLQGNIFFKQLQVNILKNCRPNFFLKGQIIYRTTARQFES